MQYLVGNDVFWCIATCVVCLFHIEFNVRFKKNRIHFFRSIFFNVLSSDTRTFLHLHSITDSNASAVRHAIYFQPKMLIEKKNNLLPFSYRFLLIHRFFREKNRNLCECEHILCGVDLMVLVVVTAFGFFSSHFM